jgi:hypothetical protein
LETVAPKVPDERRPNRVEIAPLASPGAQGAPCSGPVGETVVARTRNGSKSRKTWWAGQDSNLQPDRYERPALTIELPARLGARRWAIKRKKPALAIMGSPPQRARPILGDRLATESAMPIATGTRAIPSIRLCENQNFCYCFSQASYRGGVLVRRQGIARRGCILISPRSALKRPESKNR